MIIIMIMIIIIIILYEAHAVQTPQPGAAGPGGHHGALLCVTAVIQ